MANLLYPLCKQALLGAGIDFANDTLKVALVSAGYTYSSSDQYWSSVSGSVVGTPQTLASKTLSLGVFDAADVTFSSVTGSAVTQLVIYKDTGTASTSPLIALFDTVTGLPVTPNSGAISISWDSGASRIFAL